MIQKKNIFSILILLLGFILFLTALAFSFYVLIELKENKVYHINQLGEDLKMSFIIGVINVIVFSSILYYLKVKGYFNQKAE